MDDQETHICSECGKACRKGYMYIRYKECDVQTSLLWYCESCHLVDGLVEPWSPSLNDAYSVGTLFTVVIPGDVDMSKLTVSGV